MFAMPVSWCQCVLSIFFPVCFVVVLLLLLLVFFLWFSLRGLRAQKSLDSGVDVSSGGDESLQVGLAVDEAHGAELVQLGLEPHLWCLGLQGSGGGQGGILKKKDHSKWEGGR